MKRDFRITYDRTANLQGTTEEDGVMNKAWPSWERGQQKRDQIMELRSKKPNATIEEIANYTGLSRWQVERHKRTLIASGIWAITLIIALSGGYWLGANREEVEEWVNCHIESITEMIESNS